MTAGKSDGDGAKADFCAGVPQIALQGRVTDTAGMLTSSERNQLTERLARYETRTRHQMVVATIADLGGVSVDNFATCLGNRWGIGRKKHDDGIVILIAPRDAKVRISTGIGMARQLTDEKAMGVVQLMTPHFARADYITGLSVGIDAIAAQTGERP